MDFRLMARRPRPNPNAPATLAYYLKYLRRNHTFCPLRRKHFTQRQLANAFGYRSASLISELESPQRCRAQYQHLQLYADHFGLPAGVILLITRTTAMVKHGKTEPAAVSRRKHKALVAGLTTLLAQIENHSTLDKAMPNEGFNEAKTWEDVLHLLTHAFWSRPCIANHLKIRGAGGVHHEGV
jgi:hypothetical protein